MHPDVLIQPAPRRLAALQARHGASAFLGGVLLARAEEIRPPRWHAHFRNARAMISPALTSRPATRAFGGCSFISPVNEGSTGSLRVISPLRQELLPGLRPPIPPATSMLPMRFSGRPACWNCDLAK